MNLPVLILVHILCVEAKFREQRILPLSLQMAFVHGTKAADIPGNKQDFVPEINLNHGTYHSKAYLMDSVSLSLYGSGSTICHTSFLAKTETTSDQNSENGEYRNGNTTPFLFVFSNSTMSISYISLDCGWRGTSVGRILSSRLTINQCPIISNPESSPFVIHNGWDDFGSSIFFVDCSHESIDKSSLLTLVSLTPSNMYQPHRTDNSQEVSSTLVSCSGLSLSDSHLSFGSGPLVAFSSSTERNPAFWNKLETLLIRSKLVNITSGEQKGALKEWRGCQKILDSCVTQSTNHLYGTACIDMNLGGSLLCSNTSFSHCQYSLEPSLSTPDLAIKHHTGESGYLFNFMTKVEAVNIQRCTFLSIPTKPLYFVSSSASLSVSESSFSKCTQETNYGGVVYFQQSSQQSPFTFSSSLFVDCSAQSGGVAHVDNTDACTIRDVVFSGDRASDNGGALSLYKVTALTLSNCVFENCVADPSAGSGGGIYIMTPTSSISMDSVLFRECSADRGNDLYYSAGSVTFEDLSPNITNCDSTSETPHVYIISFPNDIIDDSLIPAVPDASTATLEGIESTPSADNTSSTIQMRVSTSVNGKMLVLVDNTNNHEPPNDDSPPAIPRLLTFDFSSSTESTPIEVLFGEWEELQYQSKYCVIGSWISNTHLSFSSTVALTTPNPPRIVQVVCSLGSGTDHCWVGLKGRTLQKGRYTVTLKNSDLSYSVEFDGSTGENTLNMFSSRLSERLFGAGSKLSFNQQYEVESITFEDDTEPFFIDPPRLYLTTPAPQPRLISVGPASFKDESTTDIVVIPIVGGNLPKKQCVLTLLSSSLESVSLPIIFTSNSTTIEVDMSSKESNQINLKYGMTYTVEELIAGTTKGLFETAFSITIPAVPNLPIVKTAQIHPNSINTTMTLSLTDSLKHNTTYTIESISRVEDNSDEIPTEGTVFFTTPKFPVPLVLHVNGKEGEDDELCGESDDPCATIDFAWSIVLALKAKSATLAIVNSSEQTQPIVVSSGMSILFNNGGNLEPTLTIPSSASIGDKAGMVVVYDAGFEVDDVTIKIESSDPSFIFLSASKSTIMLKDGSFLGEPLPTLSRNSENEKLCSWESGIVRLDQSITTINGMTFSSLSQGAFNMKNGTLTIESSSLHNNSPNISSFPSARRNIRCVEGGSMSIGSLNGGNDYIASSKSTKTHQIWINPFRFNHSPLCLR